MRIRITQKIPLGESVLHPGEVKDVEKKQAEKWIKAGLAIEFPEEVKDGNRANSSKVE